MGFYEKYIEKVTKNDLRTRNSVDAIIGRIDELLDDRPDGRLSGLVVGRVQSGKTRNYVGLALKAAEAGWNVIITLTSCNTALAAQTEKRMKRDFAKSGVGKRHAFRLNLLENVYNDFFSAAYPKDKTRFNGLFTDQVLAENGIAKTCGRPITWQYQG